MTYRPVFEFILNHFYASLTDAKRLGERCRVHAVMEATDNHRLFLLFKALKLYQDRVFSCLILRLNLWFFLDRNGLRVVNWTDFSRFSWIYLFEHVCFFILILIRIRYCIGHQLTFNFIWIFFRIHQLISFHVFDPDLGFLHLFNIDCFWFLVITGFKQLGLLNLLIN